MNDYENGYRDALIAVMEILCDESLNDDEACIAIASFGYDYSTEMLKKYEVI